MSHLPGNVEIKPTAAALGAEVRNLDGGAPVPAQVILALKQALREHHVLVFKNQDLTEAQFKDFAKTPPVKRAQSSPGEVHR